jgi:peptidoglycan/xylan/chitin deacetylase (PgdA/CDA1 family)
MPQPGIALTFDDNYIDDWYQCLPLFDSFGVKATFYISNYKYIPYEQKQKLRVMADHGHEIAYHSTNHIDFARTLHSETMAKLVKDEIEDGMEMMKKDGFYPTTFAYPYGSHTDALDKCLLRKFKSLRALNGSKNYAKSFVPNTDNSMLYAIGLDKSSKKTNEELINLVRLAKENNTCVVFVGHHIAKPDDPMHVPYLRLKKIIKTAKELGLTFYTAAEISRR